MHINVLLIQMKVSKRKKDNFEKIERWLDQIQDSSRIDLIVLPEMFNCPYETKLFPEYAEPEGGDSWRKLSIIAKKQKAYLVGGSMPEEENGHIFNTSYVFNPAGEQIAKYRKVHLFDIDIAGGQYFRESDTLTAGNQIQMFDTFFGKCGIGICYDVRFPEMSRLLMDQGAEMIIIPGAFNLTTGPLHWSLLMRARAMDNQLYLLAVSPARDEEATYQAWGHTMVVDPWGKVLGELDEKEGCLLLELDMHEVQQARRQLPYLRQRRTDLYSLSKIK